MNPNKHPRSKKPIIRSLKPGQSHTSSDSSGKRNMNRKKSKVGLNNWNCKNDHGELQENKT